VETHPLYFDLIIVLLIVYITILQPLGLGRADVHDGFEVQEPRTGLQTETVDNASDEK